MKSIADAAIENLAMISEVAVADHERAELMLWSLAKMFGCRAHVWADDRTNSREGIHEVIGDLMNHITLWAMGDPRSICHVD